MSKGSFLLQPTLYMPHIFLCLCKHTYSRSVRASKKGLQGLLQDPTTLM